jgi:phytoene synthase
MARDPVVAHCAAVLREGSRTFYRAAALLPGRPRRGAYQLYAWCRHCDDLIDHQALGQARPGPPGTAQQRRAMLAELRGATTLALDGEPTRALAFIALQRLVRDYGVPPSHPHLFLDGMAMDVDGRRYRTLAELETYCYHVAGVVGAMAAHVMGAGDPEPARLAADLGIAFQLTNIARDVIDDAAAGRIYLPLEWLAEAAVPAAEIAVPGYRVAVAGVVARLLDRAECLYRSADEALELVPRLPFRSAWAIASARGMYSEIGRLVRRRGPRAWDRRAVVSQRRKLAWLVLGLWRAARR